MGAALKATERNVEAEADEPVQHPFNDGTKAFEFGVKLEQVHQSQTHLWWRKRPR